MIPLMDGLGLLMNRVSPNDERDLAVTDTLSREVVASLPRPSEYVGALPRPAKQSDRLRELVELHLDFVWRNLRRVGNASADADEIAQEAFIVASRKLHEIRPGSERAFLLAIAMNIASTRRRSYSREALRIDRAEFVCAPPPILNPEQAVERQQARRELDAILLAMNLELRTVFVLYELEELSTKAIAELLELKEGTVASRLRRAREEFRALVQERRGPVVAILGGAK